MVLLLVANILHHRGYVGLADAEGAVPHLPSEDRPMPSLVDPREEFDLISRSASATASAGGRDRRQ